MMEFIKFMCQLELIIKHFYIKNPNKLLIKKKKKKTADLQNNIQFSEIITEKRRKIIKITRFVIIQWLLLLTVVE